MTQKKTEKKPVSRKKRTPSRGDTITIRGVGAGAAVAAGRNASATIVSGYADGWSEKWLAEIHAKIDALKDVPQDEKEDIKGQVQKIDEEIRKGPNAGKSRLEKLINTLSVMAPDIFEVVVATIQSPLAGIGIVVRKIGDKVKLGTGEK
jgi:hypothetical protein